MRIGIDGHVLGKNIGGVERHVEKIVELVPDLCPQDEFIIFISRRTNERRTGDHRPNVRYVTMPISDPIVQRSVVLPWLARKHRLDILQVQRIAPWWCGGIRILLTVHDLIPIKCPQDYSSLRDRLVRLLTPGSIARADFITCPTQVVCDEISERYPAATAPKRPFYNGVDLKKFMEPIENRDRVTRSRYGIDRPFLYSPGAIEERKNLETIVDALARLHPGSRPLLILSGAIRDRSYFRRLDAFAEEKKVANAIRHLGFVPEQDLVQLYGAASACIAASHDEGFNLLPLEALACGAPVLCSDIPVHRELYQGAVKFFPPDRPDMLAQAIAEVCSIPAGPRARSAAAEEIVSRLSWEAMAQRMAGFYQEMSQSGPTRKKASG
jgi:alpha-1,3-rhamnosyl/mannosyltransferase